MTDPSLTDPGREVRPSPRLQRKATYLTME